MPLINGSSRATIGQNIATEEKTKPRKQAIAIALDIARRAKRANGGAVHVGPIKSAVGGRTDHLAMKVPEGAYVIPADIVSGLGQGNTETGQKVLSRMFPEGRSGGKDAVPIMAAGGEHVIHPEAVKRVGNGNVDHGHSVLDRWVLRQRGKNVQTLKRLPGPSR